MKKIPSIKIGKSNAYLPVSLIIKLYLKKHSRIRFLRNKEEWFIGPSNRFQKGVETYKYDGQIRINDSVFLRRMKSQMGFSPDDLITLFIGDTPRSMDGKPMYPIIGISKR